MLSNLTPQFGLSDLEAARGAVTALIVVVECAAQLRFEGLDVFIQSRIFSLRALRLGLGMSRSSVSGSAPYWMI